MEEDCGTSDGIIVTSLIEGGEIIQPLEERILGTWRMPQEAQALQEKIKALYPHIPDEVKVSTVGAKFICQNAELLNDRVVNAVGA